MFGRQAYDLLQEVAQCPADNLPAFNVRAPTAADGSSLARSLAAPCTPACPPAAAASPPPPTTPSPEQEETFRSVIDEVHLQHQRLTSVYK